MSEPVMSEPVIEKNVPIPPRYNGERRWFRTLMSMSGGDSFVVQDERDRFAVMQCAKRNGIRVLTRKVDGVGWRIWRIGQKVEKLWFEKYKKAMGKGAE